MTEDKISFGEYIHRSIFIQWEMCVCVQERGREKEREGGREGEREEREETECSIMSFVFDSQRCLCSHM